MNLFLQTQYYLSKGSRMACTPLLMALFLSGTSYAEVSSGSGLNLKNSLKEAILENVTGVVKDNKGEPLPGVTVKIKGTNTATTTDVNGTFNINLPTGNETLVFTFIGFRQQEVAVAGKRSLDVRLQEDTQSLQEVIVTGYGGTTTKGSSTAAIDALDASEIEDLPLGNLGAALAGRMLGLGVSGGTTRPGSQAQLVIREPLTLAKDGGNTNPLYVIDDVLQINAQGLNDATLFNSLDPSEVESITILKDASAAIYGSRAAMGAVIVKTKRGKSGKPRISYSGSYAINDEAYRTKMLSAYEFAQYVNIMNGPNGANSPAGANNFFTQDELDHFKGINHDWLEQAWSSASNTRHTLNLSGGAERATYFANVSYFTQEGNLSTLDYGKWTFRAGADVNLIAGVKAGLQVSGNYSDLQKTFNKIGGENDENDYINLLRAPRYIPTYIDGLPVRLPGSGENLSAYHFYEVQNLGNVATTDDKATTLNLFAEYETPFLKGLKARVSYARNMGAGRGNQIGTTYYLYTFDRLGTNQHIYEGATPTVSSSNPARARNGNRLYYSNRNSLSTQVNFSLSYNRQFGEHNVTGFFTAERSEAESSQEDVWKEDPSNSTNGQFGTAFGTIDGRTSGSEGGSLGYVARANYSYSSKYFADLMFRTDASTKFSPDNYWGRFYSLGLGWAISEESFFNVPAVDFLKLRYNVGLLGNDDTRAWFWRQRFTFQNGKGAVFGSDSTPAGIGMKMEASPNPDATWSDSFKQNLGVDARFLNSRLSTTIEAFYDKGTNLLIERTGIVPISVGGSIASQNYGAIDFFGYELGLGWSDNIGKDFRYGIDTRFSWYDNKVKKANFNESDLMYPWENRPGESTDNGKWGFDNLGMFKTQDDINAYVTQNNITSVFGKPAADLRPGMLYYRDVRGPLQPNGTFAGPDGIIDNNDQIQLSKKASNHYGFGMTLKAGYKGLSFDAVIAGSFGGWSEIDARDKMANNISTIYQSVPAYWNNIYDPELNPSGVYPNPQHNQISLSPTSQFWQVSSFRMRMRNFNINYSLPTRLTNAMRVSNARIVFTAVNPINFYNPFDYKDSEGGWNTFPVLRTYSLGVNLSL